MNTAELYAQVNNPEWGKSYKAMRTNTSAPYSGAFQTDQASESDANQAELTSIRLNQPAMVRSREQNISKGTGAALLMPIIDQVMRDEYKTPENMRADFIKRETDRRLKEEALRQLVQPNVNKAY